MPTQKGWTTCHPAIHLSKTKLFKINTRLVADTTKNNRNANVSATFAVNK